MATLIYPEDSSGISPTNKIVDELRSVQPPTNIDQPSFIIARAAPFFVSSFEVYTGINKTGTKLIEGKDFFFTHKYVAGSNYYGKQLTGGISFTNALYKGNVYLHYQTLGGDHAVNDAVVLEELTRRLYSDIRWVRWDQLEGVPSALPPNAHEHVVTDYKTVADLYWVLKDIAAALVSSGGSGGEGGDEGARALALIVNHMAALQNAHTPEAVGLGNVRNYPIASYTDAMDKRNDRYVTPLVVTYMFQKLTEELNPEEMQVALVKLTERVTALESATVTLNSQIENINLALTNTQTTISQIQSNISALEMSVVEVGDTAQTAMTLSQQALSHAITTDSNLTDLAVRVNKIVYADNSLLPPGIHRIMVPVGTAVRVELIGAGAGSGKWFSLSTDAIITSGALTSGEDSVLWWAGTSRVPIEPFPLLIAGGGRAGMNSYGNTGPSNGGEGGTLRRFRGENIQLSTIVLNKVDFDKDYIPGDATTKGLNGLTGNTATAQAPTKGVGGWKVDASGDRYIQTYGRGQPGVTRAGGGGAGSRGSVIVRNDLKEDAILHVDVGRAGISARVSVTDENSLSPIDKISSGGLAILSLVN